MHLESVLRNHRSLSNEKPVRHNKEQPPLPTTRESPCEAMETNFNQKYKSKINKEKKNTLKNLLTCFKSIKHGLPFSSPGDLLSRYWTRVSYIASSLYRLTHQESPEYFIGIIYKKCSMVDPLLLNPMKPRWQAKKRPQQIPLGVWLHGPHVYVWGVPGNIQGLILPLRCSKGKQTVPVRDQPGERNHCSKSHEQEKLK